MGKALIQRQTHIEEAANAAFMINVGLGVLIACLLYLFAQSIAQTFFRDDRVTTVLQVMTLQVLLGALGSVQTALLQKEMGFKKLFWVRFATVSLPGLVSIPLALNGWGYWALVAGSLLGQFAQVAMLWCISHWRPGFNTDNVVVREIAKFGFWVGLTGGLAWFYSWADSLIIGYYLGSHDLGLYRMGNQAVVMGFAFISSSLMPVFYSWLSGKEKDQVLRALEAVVSVLAIVFLPISFFLFLRADYITDAIWGDKWVGLNTVLALMSISHGLSHLLIANGEVYRALGKPEFETYPMIIGLFAFSPVYLISIKGGLEEFVLARVCVVLLFGYFVHAVLAYKLLGLRFFYYVKYLLIFGVFLVVVNSSAEFVVTDFSASFAVMVVFAIVLVIFIVNKKLYVEIWNKELKARLLGCR